MKRFLSLVLSVLMIASFMTFAHAESNTDELNNQLLLVEEAQKQDESLSAERARDKISPEQDNAADITEATDNTSYSLSGANKAIISKGDDGLSQARSDQLDAWVSQNLSDSDTIAPQSVAGGQYVINADEPVYGRIYSADDAQFYLCSVNHDADYTAFLWLPSNNMNYDMAIGVYDENNVQIDYKESRFKASFYRGQRIRIEATAGQKIVVLVTSGDGKFTSDDYIIGVYSTETARRDAYEINDSFNDALSSHTFGSTINATIDNPGDMDWYILNYSGTTASDEPRMQIVSPPNFIAYVWRLSGNELQPLGFLTRDYDETKLPYQSITETYFISVVSLDGGTGNYTLKTKIGRCEVTQVNIFFESKTADYSSSENYGYGYKPVARYSAGGTVYVRDQHNVPLPGVDIWVGFDTEHQGRQTSMVVTTNESGRASFNLSLLAKEGPLSYRVGNERIRFDNAELIATYNGNIPSSYVTVPMYYFYGRVYVG